MIHIEFSEEAGFEVIPPGEYLCSVYEAVVKEGQSSGEPYIAWTFAILEGPYERRKLFYNTSLQTQALWKLRQLLEIVGVEVKGKAVDLDLVDMIGRRLVVVTGIRDWQGKEREEVLELRSAGGGATGPTPARKKQAVQPKSKKKSF